MSFLSKLRFWKKEKEDTTEKISVSTLRQPKTTTESKILTPEIENLTVEIGTSLQAIITKLKEIDTDLGKHDLKVEGLFRSHDSRIVNLLLDLMKSRKILTLPQREKISEIVKQGLESGSDTKTIVENLVSQNLCSRSTAYRYLQAKSFLTVENKNLSDENENATQRQTI